MNNAAIISRLVAIHADRVRRGEPPSHLTPAQAEDWSAGRAAAKAGQRKPRWQTAAWKLGYNSVKGIR